MPDSLLYIVKKVPLRYLTTTEFLYNHLVVLLLLLLCIFLHPLHFVIGCKHSVHVWLCLCVCLGVQLCHHSLYLNN